MASIPEIQERLHVVFHEHGGDGYALLDRFAALFDEVLKGDAGRPVGESIFPATGSTEHCVAGAEMTVFGELSPEIRLVLSSNEAGPELTLTISLPDKWRLQHAFPNVADTYFDEKAYATLCITSRIADKEKLKVETIRVCLQVAQDEPASLCETLCFFPRSRLFELESEPVTLLPVPGLTSLSVGEFCINLQLQEPQNILSGLARGTLHLWSVDFPAKIVWPPADVWVLESDFEPDAGIPLPDFMAFVKAAGGEDIPTVFNDLSGAIQKFSITDLLLKYDSSKKTVASVAITIGTTQSWTLIDPIKFSSPSIRLTVNEPFDSNQRTIAWHVEGTVGLGEKTHFHLEADHGEEGYQFYGELAPGNTIEIGETLKHFGITIPNFNPDINWLNFQLSPQEKKYAFEIGIENIVESDIFEFENLFVSFSYSEGKLSDCNLNAVFEIGGVAINVSAKHSDGGWEFLGKGENIPMGQLIERVAQEVDGGIRVPDELEDFTIKNLALQFHSETKNFQFTCTGKLKLNDKEVSAEITITRQSKTDLDSGTESTQVEKQAKASIELGGHLTIAGRKFDLSCHSEAGASRMVATYQKDGGDRIELHNLIGGDLGEQIPESLAITINDVYLAYCKEVSGAKKSAAKEITVAATQGKTPATFSGFLLGADLEASILLSDIPVAGPSLPAGLNAGVDKLRLVLASQAFQANHLVGINEDLSKADIAALALPAEPGEAQAAGEIAVVVAKGLSLSAELTLGEYKRAVSLTTAKSKASQPAKGDAGKTKSLGKTSQAAPASDDSAIVPVADTGADAGAQAEPRATPAKSDGGATWITLDRKLGPVDFHRIGLQYQNSALWVLLDVAFSNSGLTLSLDGLGVGSPLSDFKPKFKLDGIGLDYTGGGVEIGGAFLHEQVKNDLGQIFDQYSGAALIKTEALTLSAIGSYAEVDRYSSMFVYAFLDKPLGGPAFFFVTGLAAGFGYNRALKSPTKVEEIESFPLVSIAMGGNPVGGVKDETSALLDILSSLGSYVPPAPNKVFLALGIKFNSFKFIDSFALLVATFGDEFRLKLLGLSKIVAPPTISGKAPVAEMTIGLLAEFVPDDGLLKVDGKIMPGSYVLSHDCQLTGGFAFYSWFSGPHDGDFVLTVGGYHPSFRVPAHYPSIVRLALNWQIDSDLSVKGTTYFALTSSVVMAGGHLEARLDRDRLQAWFDLTADLLICWQPFHYDIALSIEIGASYRTFLGTVSASLGAGVYIWGPEFAGVARVHFIFVSFDVSFGATGIQLPPALKWEEFKTSFLPGDEDVCTIAVKNGLARTKKADEGGAGSERWVINPKHFALSIDSVIPIQQVEFTGKKPSGTQALVADDRLGIGSMGVSEFESTTTVSATRFNTKTGVKDDWLDKFRFAEVRKRMPSALWGQKRAADLNGKPIPGVLCGFEVRPAGHPDPGDTNDIKCSVLRFNTDPPPALPGVDAAWEHCPNTQMIGRWSVEAATEENQKEEKRRKLAQHKMGAFFPGEVDPFDSFESDQFDHLIGEFLEAPHLTSN